MVRRVKLDLLEIDPQEITTAEITTDHEPQIEGELSASVSRWGRYGRILIIGSGLFLIFSVCITIWFQLEKKPETKKALSPVNFVGDGLQHYNNFAVDLKDEHGNYKVLVCDIALETSANAEISRGDVVRNVIYKTLKAKTIEGLTAATAKKVLKKELGAELDKALGGKIIKEVYFTRFTLM
jgi:flagellar basal body-associated protein FliL